MPIVYGVLLFIMWIIAFLLGAYIWDYAKVPGYALFRFIAVIMWLLCTVIMHMLYELCTGINPL